MGAVETRTFRSGGGVAVKLPHDLGFKAGMSLVIERVGDHVELRAVRHQSEQKRKLAELIATLQALSPMKAEDVGRREPIDWPDRAAS